MRALLHPVAQPAAQECLATLAQGREIYARALLVFAHPDDETIGMGGILPRLPHAELIIASDGAPCDNRDAARLGLTRHAYAALRRCELEQALGYANFSRNRMRLLNLPDGELVCHLDRLANMLGSAIRRTDCDIIFTHAYEGGHPDHDALALAVHLAGRSGGPAADVIEIPFYHAGTHGWVLQSFAEDTPAPVRIQLGSEDWNRKCMMLDAHESQGDLLRAFRQPFETFRPAAAHDFTLLPNNGRLLYREVAPSLDPQEWLTLARARLRAFA